MKASNDEILERLTRANDAANRRKREKQEEREARAAETSADAYRMRVEAQNAEMKNRLLSLPTIPSRAEADAAGCFIPADLRLQPLGWTQEIVNAVGELPEDMDPREVEAYRLFPAFMAEYGEGYLRRFRTRPVAILDAWRKALNPSDYQIEQGKFIMPAELRVVVEAFANPQEGDPQWFNISPMRNTIKYLMTGEATVREAVEAAARESQYTPQGRLRFHQTVSPYSGKKAAEADWLALAQYPHAFPDDLLSAGETTLINRLVNHRFQHDEGFTSVKGRKLAGLMAQAVSFEKRRGNSVRPAKIVDLAFRFPTAGI